jgi:hypothetical protein
MSPDSRRSNRIHPPCWLNNFQEFRILAISTQPILIDLEDADFSAPESPVSRSPRPDAKADRATLAISGRECSKLLKGRSGPLSRLSKTLLTSHRWRTVSTAYFLTWRVFTTTRYRLGFLLQLSERGTAATDGLSLLPTATTQAVDCEDSRPMVATRTGSIKRLKRNGKLSSTFLIDALSEGLLPTTRVGMGCRGGIRDPANIKNGDHKSRLEDALALKLLPTATTQTAKGGKSGCGRKPGSQEYTMLGLEEHINRCAATTGARGHINPWWEEEFMGLPPGFTCLPLEELLRLKVILRPGTTRKAKPGPEKSA